MIWGVFERVPVMPRKILVFEMNKENGRCSDVQGCLNGNTTELKEDRRLIERKGIVSVTHPNELADNVATKSSSSIAKTKLSSSQSCLALNEIKEIGQVIVVKSMSNKELSNCCSDSPLRKGSGTESGFVEPEAELENDIVRNAPLSFSSLPPLEQRRQRRIQEFVKTLEGFMNGFHEVVQQMEINVAKSFFNAIPNRLAVKQANMRQIDCCLHRLVSQITARKVRFKQVGSESHSEFYIDSLAFSLVAKLHDVIMLYGKLQADGSSTEFPKCDLDYDAVLRILDDAFFLMTEYFIRIHISIRYVLYCTPRKHIDHRPLTLIVNELNGISQKNFKENSEKANEKDRSDSLPLEPNEGEPKKKSTTNVKRRYSIDNSALKKLSSLSRGLSLGRKSNRTIKQERPNHLGEKPKEQCHVKLNDKNSVPIVPPWHSTPNNRKERARISERKRSKCSEDRETSFDVYTVGYLKTNNKQGDTGNGESCSFPDPPATLTSKKNQMYDSLRRIPDGQICSTRKVSLTGRNGSVGSKKDGADKNDAWGGVTAGAKYNEEVHRMGREKNSNDSVGRGAASLQQQVNSDNAFNSKRDDDRVTAEFGSVEDAGGSEMKLDRVCENKRDRVASSDNPTRINTCDQSRATRDSTCDRKASTGAAANVVAKSRAVNERTDLGGSVDRSYCNSPLHDISSIRGCSPTILNGENAQSHSPTLLGDDGTHFYLYSSDVEYTPEVKPDVPVGNSFLTVPNLSADCYTSDEDSRLDKYLGKMYPESSRKKPFRSTADESVSILNKPRLKFRDDDQRQQQQNSRVTFQRNISRQVTVGNEEKNVRTRKPNVVDGNRASNQKPSSKVVLMTKNIYDIPAIEDSSKGIRVSVALAKKKLMDFASPKVARKKEQSIDAIEARLNSRSKNENYIGSHLNMDAHFDQNVRTFDNDWLHTPPLNRIVNDWPIRRGTTSPDNDAFENSANDGIDFFGISRPRSSTSSSVASDLSISSDFHSTVTKILRSNSTCSNSQVFVGKSTFYCKTATNEEPVKMVIGSSEESDGLSSSPAAVRVEREDGFDNAILNVNNKINGIGRIEPCMETTVSGHRGKGSDSVLIKQQKPKSIRMSKSEPLLEKNKSPSKHMNNKSFDSQKNYQGSSKVPRKRVLLWGQQFDNLLSDKDGIKIFTEFLKSEYSEENIRFWLACENFKSLKTAKISKRAHKIYNTFVEISSSCEINLDHHSRMKIKDALSAPSKDMFDTAQARIKQLMAQDSYLRFIKSPVYECLVRP